ncbi:MAG: hypothetical protein WC326_04250 [Candidatus Delongbacteria bacterium]
MSPDPFLLVLCGVLISRNWADRQAAAWRTLLPALLAPIILVCLLWRPPSLLAPLAAVLALQGLHLLLLRRWPPLQRARLLSLLLTLVTLLLVLGLPGLELRPEPPKALDAFLAGNTLLARLPADLGHRLLVWLAALWISSVELNNLITLILKRYALIPGPLSPHASPHEPARGRVIGLLERGIVCLLALHGQLEGLGLLLAAKGFARFKDLDERNFAEYVLIGTLLSVSCALLVGFWFRHWL